MMNVFDKRDHVCIIGSGISGLACSLYLQRYGIKSVIYTQDKSKSNFTSSSWLAQGGIASTQKRPDTFWQHTMDTLNAGQGYCDVKCVSHFISRSNECIDDLIKWKCKFTQKSDNSFDLNKEGGHSYARIFNYKGSQTGKEILSCLLKEVKKHDINIIYSTRIVELERRSSLHGFYYTYSSSLNYVITSCVVLCTGGIGGLYALSTNPHQDGSSLFLGKNISAKMNSLQEVQFHPTCTYDKNGKIILITEALRSFPGIRIINDKNETFLEKYSSHLLDMRNTICSHFIEEQKKNRIYLDLRSCDLSLLQKKFPSMYQFLVHEQKKYTIEIFPAQHYFIGGIKTNIYGLTNVEGLWCIGEAACSGFHGKNRIASHSLLECLIMAKEASFSISGYHGYYKKPSNTHPPQNQIYELLPVDKLHLTKTMSSLYIGLTNINPNITLVKNFLQHVKKKKKSMKNYISPEIESTLLIVQSYYDYFKKNKNYV